MIDNGGPAFAIPGSAYGGHGPEYGMSLRDYFAAAALTGLQSRTGWHPGDAARLAYEAADAMLKERAK